MSHTKLGANKTQILISGNGQFNCTYTPTKASGSCQLYMEISSSHINGSPFTVNIKPGIIDADTSDVIGIVNGVAGQTQYFNVFAQDSNSNNITNGGHTINMYLVDREGVVYFVKIFFFSQINIICVI